MTYESIMSVTYFHLLHIGMKSIKMLVTMWAIRYECSSEKSDQFSH